MTAHALALARIEGEIKRIDRHRVLSFESLGSTNEELFEKQLSFLYALKAVLELHKRSDLVFMSIPVQYACEGCGARSYDRDFLCPTADLIIKGVL